MLFLWIINATANHALPHVGERAAFMPCTEAYREHIKYTFNGYCKTIIRFTAINTWRTGADGGISLG